jgi:hypothetical protein
MFVESTAALAGANTDARTETEGRLASERMLSRAALQVARLFPPCFKDARALDGADAARGRARPRPAVE